MTPRRGGATLLGLGAVGVLLIGGSIAYGLGGAPSAMEVAVADVRPITTRIPIAVPPAQEAPSAAPDPVLDRRLREFQEALMKVWRAGLVDTATTEAEPTGGTATATAAATLDTPTATMTSTAAVDAETTTATTTATATATANPPPTTPTMTAIAAADAATTITATITTASAEAPTATAAPGPVIATIGAIAAADASAPGVRVVVYTAPGCVPCARAKAWMVRRGVAFEERDIDASTDYARQLRLLASRLVVPTFDIEGDVLIGFDPWRLLAMIQRAAQRQEQSPPL